MESSPMLCPNWERRGALGREVKGGLPCVQDGSRLQQNTLSIKQGECVPNEAEHTALRDLHRPASPAHCAL